MIYILSGNDFKKKNIFLKKICKGEPPVFLSQTSSNKEIIFGYANSTNLFGETSVVLVENIIKEGSISFSKEELAVLKETKTIFVFLEEKVLASEIKKYKDCATMEDFSLPLVKQTPKNNVFSVAEAFSRKDKIGTWILYRNATLGGVSPEEISGIIFWKIKTMILNGNNFFNHDELKRKSSELVSLYHNAHMGKVDFAIGLEQFILNSLTSKGK